MRRSSPRSSRTTGGGGVTIRLDDFLLLLIGFSQLTKSAINREIGIFAWTPLNRYITYYMLACIISTSVGIIFGRVRPVTGFFFVLKYFEYFIVYFLLVNNIENKKQARRFLVAIFLTAAIVSLIAIAQIPTGGRVVAPFEGESGEPNTLGGYLLLISSAVGGLLLSKNAVQNFWHRVALAFLAVLMFIPILFTLSRATWLAAFPVFVGFLLLSDRKLVLTLVGVAGLVVAPFAVPESVKERVLYTTEKGERVWERQQQESLGGITFDTSSSARIRSWKHALGDLPNHPVIGYGITGWRFIDAQYLRVLLETGLLGLTTFLMLLWAVLRQARFTYREVKDPLFRGVALGFFVGTLGMMAHGLMANTFIIVRVMEPFWLLTALVVAFPALEESPEQTETLMANQRSRMTEPQQDVEGVLRPSHRR